jgi:hypothetical protein
MKETTTHLVLPEQPVLAATYRILLFALVLTGMAQMPIFKRYYIADIPGLGWLAEYYLTHTLHYLGASLLVALLIYCAVVYVGSLRKRYAPTGAAIARIAILAAIVVTGGFRVLKNLPDIAFSPAFTLFVDIAHLGFMMALLLLGAAAVVCRWCWLVERKSTRSASQDPSSGDLRP